MALVTTTEMFKKAYDGGYAIGAFNVNNMEIVQGITEAAGELNSPVILQVSKGARAYANHTYLVKLVEAAVIENPEIPIALHLDHGDSFELCKSCIDGGFTSVMIDASSKSFEDNIALTRKVVEYAHDHGVVVEVTSLETSDKITKLGVKGIGSLKVASHFLGVKTTTLNPCGGLHGRIIGVMHTCRGYKAHEWLLALLNELRHFFEQSFVKFVAVGFHRIVNLSYPVEIFISVG